MSGTLDAARSIACDLTRVRRALHAEPELGLHLPRTQQMVLDALADLPLEVSTGDRLTSVTAVLRGTSAAASRSDAPAVLLRADMDALPIQETTGLAFASTIDGVMHACGHDLHTAMLVGAARLLAARRDQLDGDVVFMFQPGEEGWDGAALMIDEGVLDAAGRRVSAAFGMHVFSAGVPAGVFATRSGPMMSASNELQVTVHGRGGHGSAPHRAADPVPAVAEMVLALQSRVTRCFDAFDPVVVTVGLLQAGTKANVIPGTASFAATVRTFSAETSAALRENLSRLVRGIAAAHDLDVSVDYVEQYPPTVNDPAETRFAAHTIASVLGAHRHAELPNPFMASEDFSRVLALVGGSFIAVGATPPATAPGDVSFNHGADAIFDDAVLPDGAAVYAELALRRLSTARPRTPCPDS